jgi:hypothetical protein
MREELCKTDPHNSKSLERIESGIVCVALDDTSPITRDEVSIRFPLSCYKSMGTNKAGLHSRSLDSQSGPVEVKTGFLINSNVSQSPIPLPNLKLNTETIYEE